MRKLLTVFAIILLLGVVLAAADKENLQRNEDKNHNEDEKDFKYFIGKNGRIFKDEEERAQRKQNFVECKQRVKNNNDHQALLIGFT